MNCRYCGGAEGLYNHGGGDFCCRSCNTKRAQKYRKTPNGRSATQKAVKVYESKNPLKRAAWNTCQKLGNKPCEVCGSIKTDKHHPDYTKPKLVKWLCRLHHKQEHTKVN